MLCTDDYFILNLETKLMVTPTRPLDRSLYVMGWKTHSSDFCCIFQHNSKRPRRYSYWTEMAKVWFVSAKLALSLSTVLQQRAVAHKCCSNTDSTLDSATIEHAQLDPYSQYCYTAHWPITGCIVLLCKPGMWCETYSKV